MQASESTIRMSSLQSPKNEFYLIGAIDSRLQLATSDLHRSTSILSENPRFRQQKKLPRFHVPLTRRERERDPPTMFIRGLCRKSCSPAVPLCRDRKYVRAGRTWFGP